MFKPVRLKKRTLKGGMLSDLLPCTGAAEATAGAPERPLHGHDLSAQAVSDPEHEGP